MIPFRFRSMPAGGPAAGLLALAMILVLLVGPGFAAAQTGAPTPETPDGKAHVYTPDPVLEGLEPFTRAPITATVTFDDAHGDAPRLAPGANVGPVGPELMPESVEAWLPGFCPSGVTCLVGDFNADGRDDVAALYRDRPEPERGDVWVALRTARGFAAAVKWSDNFCATARICKVGDFNGDNRDDLVSFAAGVGAAPGQVQVALAGASGFEEATSWIGQFCQTADGTCDVGDFDGNGRDDIAFFTRTSTAAAVWVARSLGGAAFTDVRQWNGDFCRAGETCAVGNFDGDADDDIVAFVQATITQAGQTSPAWVALSNGTTFAAGTIWSTFFCLGGEQCRVGDFDGDGKDDGLVFVPGTRDAWVGLSTGTSFSASSTWNADFCQPGEECQVGDFDGNGRDDVIRFLRPGGGFYIALAGGSGNSGFYLTPPGGAKPGLWSEDFCRNTLEVCAMGDFDGDGRDDVARFTKNSVAGSGANDVFVALSSGNGFSTEQLWSNEFCQANDQCKVGDFNADGKDDLVAFRRDAAANGQVWVALSTGGGFLEWSAWNNAFCVYNEWCEVGDFNGDGYDDVVTFLRNAYTDNWQVSYYADVRVALNSRGGQFYVTSPANWHDLFCAKDEQCGVADFNGDGLDDIVSFVRAVGKVYVATSNGSAFVNAKEWQGAKPFCIPGEICGAGDFNGDGADDVIAFTRSAYVGPNPASFGDVWVALSNRSGFDGSTLWNDLFCVNNETCGTGDFNGDQRDDVITFLKSTVSGDRAGDVYVGLARYGTGYYFRYSYERVLFQPLMRR